jgi:hypothetical protein
MQLQSQLRGVQCIAATIYAMQQKKTQAQHSETRYLQNAVDHFKHKGTQGAKRSMKNVT